MLHLQTELLEDQMSFLEEEKGGSQNIDKEEAELPLTKVQNLNQFEYTLAIIKPDVMKHRNKIEKYIKDNKFTIIQSQILKFSPEKAAEFFMPKSSDKIEFPRLICLMASNYSHVMVLAKEKAIRKWQHLMGPEDSNEARRVYPLSLRAIYGKDNVSNGFYGSSNQIEAIHDTRFFFKDIPIETSYQHSFHDTALSNNQFCASDIMYNAKCTNKGNPPLEVNKSYTSNITKTPMNRNTNQSQINLPYPSDKIYLQEQVFPVLQQGLKELVRIQPNQMYAYEWFINWLLENDNQSAKVYPINLGDIPN